MKNVIVVNSDMNTPGGTYNVPANSILKFEGGSYIGGTINGNNTIIIAPPYKIFNNVTLGGTWLVDQVYADYFGDTGPSVDSSIAINKALAFSNLIGCRVILLPIDYRIDNKIQILGGTKLEGTFARSPFGTYRGTNIISSINSSNPAMLIETNATTGVDCYRFEISNINIDYAGTGTAIEIKTNTNDVPRNGSISNMSMYCPKGHGIVINCGSYIRIENIHMAVAKGVKLTGNSLMEFIWMRQICIGSRTGFSAYKGNAIEINKGNNIYLTEIDTNDLQAGIVLENSAANLFNVFVTRFNTVRCVEPIKMNANNWITRIKFSEVTISSDTTTSNAILFNRSGIYGFTECTFDNVNIDYLPAGAYAINDSPSCLSHCSFTNIRTGGSKIQLGGNNLFTQAEKKQADVFTGNTNITQQISISSSSPFSRIPIVIVNTNQTIPFKVDTFNNQGGNCYIEVTFASQPLSNVVFTYYLTGYFK